MGVGNVVPVGFGANEHVIAGANARIRVKCAHGEIAELATTRDTETGPAGSAEGPTDAGRGLVHRQMVLPSEPTEIFGVHLRIGSERRPMKSATHRAMAISDVKEWPIHLVSHRAAKATTLNGHAAVSSVA
jgi:hypothetical protein